MWTTIAFVITFLFFCWMFILISDSIERLLGGVIDTHMDNMESVVDRLITAEHRADEYNRQLDTLEAKVQEIQTLLDSLRAN
jgi:hypothetical protein